VFVNKLNIRTLFSFLNQFEYGGHFFRPMFEETEARSETAVDSLDYGPEVAGDRPEFADCHAIQVRPQCLIKAAICVQHRTQGNRITTNCLRSYRLSRFPD